MDDGFSLPRQDSGLRSFAVPSMLQRFTEVLQQFWLPPHEMKGRIEALIASQMVNQSLQVVISGETTNVTLYLLSSTEVFVLTPFKALRENTVLRELALADALPSTEHWSIFPGNIGLRQRLSLPQVLLVNLCVLEHFPIPRLCLNVSLLASFLRKYQKADVFVMDMQFGLSLEDIVRHAVHMRPDLIGISISYGQKHLADALLDELFHVKESHLRTCQMMIGNIIPASFPQEFLTHYPDLLVAYGEGELTIVKTVEYLTGACQRSAIPGVVYADPSGSLCFTPSQSTPLEQMPLPALDTIRDLARWRGALTLELSRGCQWNVCTFCPRDHKAHHWKTLTTAQILEQFEAFRRICDHFGCANHLFLADEEFVGGLNDGMETERMTQMAQQLLVRNIQMRFDAAARVDQVYHPKMDRSWHIQRMQMWHICRQAGLDRLFLGIESGSQAQLRRYGKGIDVDHSILAIRLLSALGIPLRFGFITFDQLMRGFNDLKENIAFLERNDAFMRPIDVAAYGYERLFDLLTSDQDFIRAHTANKPVYAGISYMLSTMEVLIKSRYALLLQQAEERSQKPLILNRDRPDTNMGRYQVAFVDDLIGDLSVSCQKWIDRHFGLAYSVKSLYKVAPAQERPHLMQWMVRYRQTSFFLLKGLVSIFDTEEDGRFMLKTLEPRLPVPVGQVLQHCIKQAKVYAHKRLKIIEEVLNAFDTLVASENALLEALLRHHALTDTADGQLSNVLQAWDRRRGIWTLIHGSNTEGERGVNTE